MAQFLHDPIIINIIIIMVIIIIIIIIIIMVMIINEEYPPSLLLQRTASPTLHYSLTGCRPQVEASTQSSKLESNLKPNPPTSTSTQSSNLLNQHQRHQHQHPPTSSIIIITRPSLAGRAQVDRRDDVHFLPENFSRLASHLWRSAPRETFQSSNHLTFKHFNL